MSRQDAPTDENVGRTLGLGRLAVLFLAVSLLLVPITVAAQPSTVSGPSNELTSTFANKGDCPRVSGSFPPSNGSTATVSFACLPDGGFIGLYRYTTPDQSNSELVGVSEYLREGKHSNITIPLFDVPNKSFGQDSLSSTTTLVVRLHRDTNSNEHFDYLDTYGSQDDFYRNGNIIHDTDPLTVQGTHADSGGNGKSKEDTGQTEADDSTSDTSGTQDSQNSEPQRQRLQITNDADHEINYTFSVDGELASRSDANTKNISNAQDSDGMVGTGVVASEKRDTYSYTGSITSFNVSDANVSVYSGERIDPSDYPDTVENATDGSQSDGAPSGNDGSTDPQQASDNDGSDGSSSSSSDGSNDNADSDGSDSSDNGAGDSDSGSDSGTQDPPTQQVAGEVADQDSGSLSITFENQSIDGQSVTIDSVTVPDGGFVVLHGSLYQEGIGIPDTYAVSRYLSPGTHRDVAIDISNNVPGDTMNVSRLNRSELLTATLHRDTNDNQRFDFFRPDTDTDVRYTTDNNNPVEDTAIVTVKGSSGVLMPGGTGESTSRGSENGTGGTNGSPSAPSGVGVTFPDQGSSGASVTIDSVTVPDGGYIVIHNSTYLPPLNNSLDSVVGVSHYLQPGNYTDLSVPLFNYSGYEGTQRRLQQSQKLVASVNYDSNDNQQFDFITSGGSNDVGYLYSNNTLVYDTGFATVSASAKQTQTGSFGNETITQQPTQNASQSTQANAPPINIEGQQVATPTETTQSSEEQQSGGVTGFIFNGLTIIILLVLVGVAAVAGIAYRRS